MTLEELIRDRARTGRLNHLSIAWTQGGWDITYRGVEDRDHRVLVATDPVDGLRVALGSRVEERTQVKPAPKKSAATKPDPFGDIL